MAHTYANFLTFNPDNNTRKKLYSKLIRVTKIKFGLRNR